MKKFHLKYIIAMLWLMVLTPLYAVNNFRVFDATLYKSSSNLRDYGIPTAAGYGIDTLEVIYEGDIWPDSRELRDFIPSKQLLDKSIRRVRKKFVPFDIKVVCIDIEHWSLNEKGKILRANKDKYIKTVDAYKQGMPGIEFGFYSMVPIRNFYDALKGEDSDKFIEWQTQNNNLTDVASHVDVIFPSLYTFTPNREDWVKYAVANIKEAKKYGKKVYVFIWPQYHESANFIGLDYLPTDFFELQLNTIYMHADGVVIWGGWDIKNSKQAAWDENAEWWKLLVKFMGNLPK